MGHTPAERTHYTQVHRCARCSQTSANTANQVALSLALNFYIGVKAVNMSATANAMQTMTNTPGRRGLKPGQRHAGQFRKGDDPRRIGALKLADGTTLAQKARQLGPAILEFWDELWRDESVPLPVRIKASENILERGYGKAVSTIDLSVTENRPARALTMQELEAIAAQGHVIEGELAVSEAVAETNE